MHGQHREDRQHKWHMWPGPSQRSPVGTEVDSSQVKSFSKAGRKIVVGDTALFQAGNAPPFIGIIRKLTTEKEGSLKLTVNWLYRPGDIKLGKGASLEAAPNEIFYSFHKDEISAASLLHPCKVAFLQKGVELPPGVSSFVCRRVYDTTNKCLYWLTDRDYTDEHQAEVDKLLDKTKHEMQTVPPSQGSSQRASTAPTSSKADTVNASLSNQVKSSKKRERTDQNSDPSKRERLIKVDDSESKPVRFEDFAAFAEKDSGLTSPSHVDQLVQVMLQERNDSVKKVADVVSQRILLASVIAATDREECLTHLLQLGGLPVLDDWLQEAHKGKTGDGSPKEGDKGLEELLLTLLKALDKLPVDLDALKTCMIGKSVNNLRSHKNTEIQKKARKLVDTWKKRVDAEMKSSDEGKPGLNSATNLPSKPLNENLSTKGRSAGGSKTKPAVNGSASLADAKYNLSSVIGAKEHAGNSKDNSVKSHLSGTSEVLAPVKEEKSCSSSQSHNNSQSCCTASVKGAGQSVKDDMKAPVIGSIGNKTPGATLRSHKNHSMSISGGHSKESTGRHRSSGLEKANSLEKAASDGNRAENSNSQRLIVRIPNPARSPVQSVSGGSLVDANPPNNKGSSPVSADKHESGNGSSRAPIVSSPDTSGDARCGNSSATNVKFRVECKEEVDRSSVATAEEESCKSTVIEKDHNIGKDSLDTPMDAVKKEIPSASLILSPDRIGLDSVEGGIDLLASIATCDGSETEKSFTGSNVGEAAADCNKELAIDGRSSREPESRDKDGDRNQNHDGLTKSSLEPVMGDAVQQSVDLPQEALASEKSPEVLEDAKCLTSLPGNDLIDIAKGASQFAVASQCVGREATVDTKDGSTEVQCVVGEAMCDTKECVSRQSPDLCNIISSTIDCQTTLAPLDTPSVDGGSGDTGKAASGTDAPGIATSICTKVGDVTSAYYEEDALEVARQVAREVEEEVDKFEKPEAQESVPCSPTKNMSKSEISASEDPLSGAAEATMLDKDKERLTSGDSHAFSDSAISTEKMEEHESDKGLSVSEVKKEQLSSPDGKGKVPSDLENMPDCDTDTKEMTEDQNKQTIAEESMLLTDAGVQPELDNGSLLSSERKIGFKEVERPVFDLNEGFLTEDIASPSSHVHASDPSVLTQTAQLSSLATPVAVVSATKGGFPPPSNLKARADLGWKGSAATSAFRPAEPRRVMESSQTALDTDVTSMKQNRFLDIDLNVADERVMEDLATTSNSHPVLAGQDEAGSLNETINTSKGYASFRPELDLNRADGIDEGIGPSLSVSKVADVTPETNGCAMRVMLDFDLNDGPSVEESVPEVPLQHRDAGSSAMPVLAGMRQNSELVNAAPWYTTASSAVPATMVIPAYPSNPLDQSYPVMTAPNIKPIISTGQSHMPFNTDLYRGAPTVSYSAPLPAGFPYAGFPFGSAFPFTSASYNLSSTSHVSSSNPLPYPATTSQLVSAGTVVPPYGRQYLMGTMGKLPATESNASWGRPSLDLNAGPDISADPDARDGLNPQITAGLAQFSYQQAGPSAGTLKRKEPETGFDPYRSNFKQMSWR